jgi:acetyltransferase
MRLFYTRRSIERSELARLTQIDYEREMAIVATAVIDGEEQTLGVVRVFVDPDNVEAEYGILIRSDMKGTGLGWLLMNKIIAFLKGRGTQRLTATVLRENERMLSMAVKLGFVHARAQPEEGTRRIELALR